MKTYLNPEDVRLIKEQAETLRDKPLIQLLLHLGCRLSEALAITIDDIDLVSGTVTIQHLKERIKLKSPECNPRLGRNNTFCPGCGQKVSEAAKVIQQIKKVNGT